MRLAGIFAMAAGLIMAPYALQAKTGDPNAPIEEAAADLAYGFCPLYVAGAFPLEDNKTLTGMGFDANIDTAVHPKHGPVKFRTVERSDGGITFGGAEGKYCSVTVAGDKKDAVVARWHRDMKLTGIAFKEIKDETVNPPAGAIVKRFQGTAMNGEQLNIRIVDDQNEKMALFQIFLNVI